MIRISALNKSFNPLKAVDNVSFTVAAGEVLGILGPNGAGKTTCMQMISGFLLPDSGHVEIFGLDMVKQSQQAKALIGYLPEGAPSYGDMSVHAFLTFVANIRGLYSESAEQAVAKAIERLQLAQVQQQRIETLSKGFKRRVGLAQAILHDPAVLILDEPTDGLDPNQKKQVRTLIQNLSEDKIVLISTHILEEVDAICSRVIILNRGAIVADASPAHLRAQSRYFRAVTLTFFPDFITTGATSTQHLLATLEALEGVSKVVLDGDAVTIFPLQGKEIFRQIYAVVEQNKWPLKEFQVESGRLHDVFHSLTEALDNV